MVALLKTRTTSQDMKLLGAADRSVAERRDQDDAGRWLRERMAQPVAGRARACTCTTRKLMPGMLTPEQMAQLDGRQGRGVRPPVPGVHDSAPRRRAGDGEGPDGESGRGPGRRICLRSPSDVEADQSGKSIACAACARAWEMTDRDRADVRTFAWRQRGTVPHDASARSAIADRTDARRRRRRRRHRDAAASRTCRRQPVATPTAAQSNDPRVGLKAGLDDAGGGGEGLELVGHLDKPEAFQDPDGSLNFANSDLAFQGHASVPRQLPRANFYNVEDPRKPQLRVSVPCPGGQGDVSVLRQSVVHVGRAAARPRRLRHAGRGGRRSSPERFRGVRIFDISDIEKPKQIAAVQTCRGSHTHTLVVDPDDKENIYIYGSGTSGVRSGEELAGCSSRDPDGRSGHRAVQHRRDSGAAEGAGDGQDRQPSAHLRGSVDGRDRRAVDGRQPRRGHADVRA